MPMDKAALGLASAMLLRIGRLRTYEVDGFSVMGAGMTLN
jgi:hypothetical protein